jgi:DNA-3-methyladenine glycosylase II
VVPPGADGPPSRLSPTARAGGLYLAGLDPRLAELRRRHGVPRLVDPRPGSSRFEQLARSICFQQLAGKAAAAIWARVQATVGPTFTPEGVVTAGFESLRLAGLSTAKAVSILDLADKVAGGQVKLDRIGRLGDEAVIEHLIGVRGIGRWTAEMFLLFTLGRLDVWPVTDLGVRMGYRRVFDMPEPLAPRDLYIEGERYKPYRSVLAWWCWRAMDTTT